MAQYSLADLLVADKGEIINLGHEIDQELFPHVPSIEEILRCFRSHQHGRQESLTGVSELELSAKLIVPLSSQQITEKRALFFSQLQ